MLQYSANMTEDKLKRSTTKAPIGPGIYIFKGAKGKYLYIGKASNIKARLLSYQKTTDQRILQMLSQAVGVKLLSTDSEIEALIIESQYIKRYRPAFNIRLRDDTQYFYVGFTREKWPKIFLTHQPHQFESRIKNQELRARTVRIHNSKFIIQNSNYVGPFVDGNALKTTMRYLRKTFPYCTCKKPHNNFCLN